MGAALSVARLLVDTEESASDEESPSTTLRRQRLINESLLDVLIFLDRDNLDIVQDVCQRFRELVDDRMQLVCLRPLSNVTLNADHSSSGWPSRPISHYCASVTLKKPATQEDQPEPLNYNHDEAMKAAEWLMARLRSGVIVDSFIIHDVPLTWDLCRVFASNGSRIRITGELKIYDANASPAAMQKFLTEGPAEIRTIRLDEYNYSFRYRPSHISNELVKACAEVGVARLFLPEDAPQFADHFQLSDDGILDFCFRPGPVDVDAKVRELNLGCVQLTPNFFQKLIEASRKSTLSVPLRLKIENLRPHNQNTTEYADIRRQLTHCQLFDFNEGPTRFQIAIYQPDTQNLQSSTLEFLRGPAPSDGTDFFY